jgi:multiple sugar transport system permease protein
LEEAARIDGCNAFRTYWTIVLPVAGSALLVCTILSIVWHWNDYFEPVMYITRPVLQLLPQKLPDLYNYLSKGMEQDTMPSEILSFEGTVMAATFLVILPILIVYLFLQKKFMESIERSGLVG